MLAGFRRQSPAFLASVATAAEACLAVSGGADIIDCKDPQKGALGALDAHEIFKVVEAVGGRVPVSATIGDLPSAAAIMVKAATSVAATGVDIVKVGFFGDADASAAIVGLGAADLGRARLVAVLMADRRPDFAVMASLAEAGFAGVMLDTADKSSGALPDVLDRASLADFISLARKHGLTAGLAGALRQSHIAGILALQPDVIGFRGALCAGGRTDALALANVQAVRGDIDAVSSRAQQSKRSVA
jgi:uncharacterized protein (UPF0264 family)